MTFVLLLFYVFAAVTLAAAIGVVTVKNPVHATLSLVLTFFTVACIWILIGAEFLGVALVLVYVGAVMVLFLFVVMMLDIDSVPLREGFSRYLPAAGLVAGIMASEMLALVGTSKIAGAGAIPVAKDGSSNIAQLGHELFSNYILPFEVAAVILTVAIIAAVALTLRRRGGVRHQTPGQQVLVRKEDRIRILKMPATRTETKP